MGHPVIRPILPAMGGEERRPQKLIGSAECFEDLGSDELCMTKCEVPSCYLGLQSGWGWARPSASSCRQGTEPAALPDTRQTAAGAAPVSCCSSQSAEELCLQAQEPWPSREGGQSRPQGLWWSQLLSPLALSRNSHLSSISHLSFPSHLQHHRTLLAVNCLLVEKKKISSFLFLNL